MLQEVKQAEIFLGKRRESGKLIENHFLWYFSQIINYCVIFLFHHFVFYKLQSLNESEGIRNKMICKEFYFFVKIIRIKTQYYCVAFRYYLSISTSHSTIIYFYCFELLLEHFSTHSIIFKLKNPQHFTQFLFNGFFMRF